MCIIVIIVFILFGFYCWYSTLGNFNNDIFKYSLMVHLDNDKVSEERIQKVEKIYDEYGLPINLMKATHWNRDVTELHTYPLEKTAYQFVKRPGAYGLAGSLYKCLKKAYDEDWPYLLFLEDDSIPILPKYQFFNKFNEVIDSLPDNGNGIYILGTNIYCKNIDNLNEGWYKKYMLPIRVAGSHAVLFSKQSISDIINHLKYNKIDKAIDNYIHNMKDVWFYIGDVSESKMFTGLYDQIDTYCDYRINTMPLQ
jgi:GR25 family glycosyltransferase involved in LPS biosynthesis